MRRPSGAEWSVVAVDRRHGRVALVADAPQTTLNASARHCPNADGIVVEAAPTRTCRLRGAAVAMAHDNLGRGVGAVRVEDREVCCSEDKQL
eukprot:3603204-Prymnesium_polylepis.1